MKYNLKELNDIFSARGNRGETSPRLIMNKKGTIIGNKPWINKEKGIEIKEMNSAKMKAKKTDDSIISAITFLEDVKDKDSKRKDIFSLTKYKDDNGEIKRFTLSGASIFRSLNLKAEKIMKDNIELKPEIQEFEGQKYFIFEIPLKQ